MQEIRRIAIVAVALAGFGALVDGTLNAAQATGQATAQTSASGAATVLEVRNFVGRIALDTAPGRPVAASVTPGAGMPDAQVQRRGRDLVVTGGWSDRDLSQVTCRGTGDAGEVRIAGRWLRIADLPVIEASGPVAMGLRARRTMLTGTAGAVGGATLDQLGCGALVVGDIAGGLEASLAGSGSIATGAVGRDVEISVAGDGSVNAGPVRGRSNVNLAGSGTVRLAGVGGPVDISIAGSGRVALGAGEAPLSVSVAGSGSVVFDGTAVDPSVSLMGSGRVRVASVRGTPSVSRMGSGTFESGS